ncbi:MAG: hypothetical protein RXO43_02545 [Candidatus Micrarchaeota archaeon]
MMNTMVKRPERPDRFIFNRYYSTPKEQEGDKYTTLAQELGKKYDEFIRFTSSPKEFEKALKEKFGGNIDQFNQYLILSALILEYLKKAAEEDEGLKKLLSSLQEKRDAINKNMEKIAKELGYTVSSYSLDKLKGKDLNGVKETLARDFGVEPKLEVLFSSEALNSLTDLIARMVNKYSSVNVAGEQEANVNVLRSPGEKAKNDVNVLQSPGKQQNGEYHSPYRKTGKNIAITGVVLGILGGLLFAWGFVYLPMAAFGLVGIGLAELGFSIFWIGGAIWIAGLMGEAWHNHRVQKAQEKALKQEEKKTKEEQKNNKKALNEQDKKQKKIEETEEKYKLWKATNAEKDEEALKKQLTDPRWLEKHIKAETKAEHEKRVEEAKKEIEKIMEEEKKLGGTIPVNALHDLLIKKAEDPNTPSWFLALLAQLRLSHFYTDVDMLKALAGNPNTPPELLADFATRKRYFWTREYIGSDIREIAAKNLSTPPEILAKLLLGDKDPRVEYAVAANPKTPTDALDAAMYSKKVDINIKRVIAMNPSASPDALEYALKDKDLALYALDNPLILKLPYLLELALKNPDRSVSEKAQEILKKLIEELKKQNEKQNNSNDSNDKQ